MLFSDTYIKGRMKMGFTLVRFQSHSEIGHSWAVVRDDNALPIEGNYKNTCELFENAVPALKTGNLKTGGPLPLNELRLLSPVTHPCRIIAQALNYGAHAKEAGLDPAKHSANVLFRKSSAAISGPHDNIVRPAPVRLLDYEIELGLVIGTRIRGPVKVDEVNMADFIGAFVIANDVSARDVQIPEGQHYRGKSYRTFCPCGPFLFVPDAGEFHRWKELRMTLRVNGELRQDARCGEMINKPEATLSEISMIEDLDPGDMILTGTPGGVALLPPRGFAKKLSEFLPERIKWRMFVASQLKRPQYLNDGDCVTASIKTPDGLIDLGEQKNLVR